MVSLVVVDGSGVWREEEEQLKLAIGDSLLELVLSFKRSVVVEKEPRLRALGLLSSIGICKSSNHGGGGGGGGDGDFEGGCEDQES